MSVGMPQKVTLVGKRTKRKFLESSNTSHLKLLSSIFLVSLKLCFADFLQLTFRICSIWEASSVIEELESFESDWNSFPTALGSSVRVSSLHTESSSGISIFPTCKILRSESSNIG